MHRSFVVKKVLLHPAHTDIGLSWHGCKPEPVDEEDFEVHGLAKCEQGTHVKELFHPQPIDKKMRE